MGKGEQRRRREGPRTHGRSRSNGFTLVEIMVSATVGIVVVLGIAEFMQFMAKSTKATMVSSDWVSQQNLMMQAFTNISICDAIAVKMGQAGVGVDSNVNNNASNAVHVPSISYQMGANTNTLATTGQQVNGLAINSILLWALSPPSTYYVPDVSSSLYNQYLVNLQVNAGVANYLQGSGGGSGQGSGPGTGRVQNFKPFNITFNALVGPYDPGGGVIPGTPPVLQGCAQ